MSFNPLLKLKYLSLSIGLLLMPITVFSKGNSVLLEDGKDHYYISPNLEFYCDQTHSLQINDITNPNFSSNFSNLQQPYFKDSATLNNYWVRFTLINRRSNENKSWYFESWSFNIDDVEFYVPDNKMGYLKTSMGYFKEFNERPFFHKNFLFHIDIRPGEQATYYVKLKNRYPMHLIFHIRTGEEFIEHALTEYWLLGLFYGIFLFIIFINLYLFIRLKDKIYLFYLFCLISEVLYCLGRDGLGFQFIWPALPRLNQLTHHNTTQFLLIFSTLLYAIHFLSLKKNHLLLYRLSVYAIIFKAIIFFSFYIYPIHSFYTFTMDCLILFIPFISGIISLKRGNKFVKYYVVAFSCLFLSFLLIFLNESKLLPFTVLNWYFINIGMLLEGIFLAIALIDQVRILREENIESQEKIVLHLKENELLKDKVNRELEQKVEERTNRIKQLNAKLEEKNQQLLYSYNELEVLSAEVRIVNGLLSKDNEKLKTDITKISKSRVMHEDVSSEEFMRVFPDENACLKFLSDLKWKNGYTCRKCGYQKSGNSKTANGKRCKNCNYDESATTNTLFHKLKFPITKAFYMVYVVSTRDKNITLEELSEILSLRRETCWSFRQKILSAKKSFEDMNDKKEVAEGWGALALISLSK
jgi:hypothetical protein